MKICFVSYEYEPFPGGGIATYHNAAAKALAEAGHEVHVVTNRAFHGATEPRLTQRYWREGNLVIHRLRYFDEKRQVHSDAQFFDINTGEYSNPARLWAREPSNIASQQAAAYIESLHAEVGLDVIEVPEFFAEAFYVLRRRASGDRGAFPPVCVHGHISSRIAFGVNHHVWELGWQPHRHMMLREEYCVQHADALITPSRALMGLYDEQFPGGLPEIRDTIPYYLELPENVGDLPAGIDEGTPYLALIGRVEPRKGPDVAMRAFARLAADYPELRLVLMGKEMWHQGESVDDVIASNVPEQFRNRIVRMGQVPRDQALAVARHATAFLHPAPWDNYPCATLEAMAVGATCIVSDTGGQSEMVEDGDSGLVFPAGDDAALAACAKRVLDDSGLKKKLADNAVTRLRKITDPATLTERKLAVFEKMVAREREAVGEIGSYREPAFLAPDGVLPELPGEGVVVLDVEGANPQWVAATRDMLTRETQSSGKRWKLYILADPDREVHLPTPWERASSVEPAPWKDIPGDHTVVYVLAGVRLDHGTLRNVVAQVQDAAVDCGSFAWLRPPTPRVFPYPSDFGHNDLLMTGQVMPPMFAVRAAHLAGCTSFAGLRRSQQRLCALLAGSSAAGEIVHQHIGQVCGDYYSDLPIIQEDTLLRAVGYLEVMGVLPAVHKCFGNATPHLASTPEVEAAEEERQAKQAKGQKQGQQASRNGAQQPARAGVDARRLAELEKVYREHTALKNMAPVRWMRKAGVFSVARAVFPKSKKMIGDG